MSRQHEGDSSFVQAITILRCLGWGMFAAISAVCALSRLSVIIAGNAAGLSGESLEKTMLLTCWMVMSFIVASAIDKAMAGK